MTDGCRIWDANGVLIFDETTPVIKFLGTYSLGAGSAQTGTITDARFTAYFGHTPFFARIDGGRSTDYWDAIWTFSGNNMTWTYPAEAGANRPVQTIIYGIR